MHPDSLLCVVEIPRGGRNKYEYDPKLGAIKLDRFISASVVYPTEYGYVPDVVCVPWNDPGWNTLDDIDDLPEQLRKEIGHFFEIYKDLDPDRCSEVIGWDNRVAAFEAIDTGRRAFRENGGY